MIASLGKNWDNRNKSRVLTIGVHVLLLLLALWPFLQVSQWTEEKGVMVEFSEIIIEEPQAQNTNTKGNQPSSPKSMSPAASAPTSNDRSVKSESKTETIVQEESEVVRQPVSSDSPQASSEEEERDFANLFNSKNSTSATSDPGSPDLSKLKGLSTVTSSEVGEGLKGRRIVFVPEIKDNTQRAGRVVVRICVNKEGMVSSADYTQRGSTTTDSYLVDKAVSAARQWRFSTSELTKQCGLITIDFDLK